MEKLKKMLKGFATDESGAETIEIIMGIAIAAVLVGVVMGVIPSVRGRMNSAIETIDGMELTPLE